MLFFESKKYSYLKQFFILTAPFLVLGIAAFLMSSLNAKISPAQQQAAMDKLLTKENANMLRFSNVIATFFLFLGPAFIYAKICHQKARKHLGLQQTFNFLPIVGVIFLMFSSLFIVGLLTKITELLPWPQNIRLYMKGLEDSYLKQIEVLANFNGFGDYLISLVVIAICPAIFEEVLFRGALQNLLTRWIKKPIVAIIITSIIFSAIHMSISGFLGRAFLGFILGWIFYKTGNLWYSIIGHAFNNALAVTVMYVMQLYKNSQKTAIESLDKMDKDIPWGVGLFGIIMIIGALFIFNKLTKDLDKNELELDLDNFDNKPSWMK